MIILGRKLFLGSVVSLDVDFVVIVFGGIVVAVAVVGGMVVFVVGDDCGGCVVELTVVAVVAVELAVVVVIVAIAVVLALVDVVDVVEFDGVENVKVVFRVVGSIVVIGIFELVTVEEVVVITGWFV